MADKTGKDVEAKTKTKAKKETKQVDEVKPTTPQYPTDLQVLNERMGALNEPEKAEAKEKES